MSRIHLEIFPYPGMNKKSPKYEVIVGHNTSAFLKQCTRPCKPKCSRITKYKVLSTKGETTLSYREKTLLRKQWFGKRYGPHI